MEEALTGVATHDVHADFDHHRTVTAFSGDEEAVFRAVEALAEVAMPAVDLSHHVGVHPRIGALDVCPFVLPPGEDDRAAALDRRIEAFAEEFAGRYEIPVYLYEGSARPGRESRLPELRRGGFGKLLAREIDPDFGPSRAHPRWGVTVMGRRDFLLAVNVHFDTDDKQWVRTLAAAVRRFREDGDERFLGVRALGLCLPARNQCQLSLNVTLPDLTPLDPIFHWAQTTALVDDLDLGEIELVGVIRRQDLPQDFPLVHRPSQVVW
jgi:glutamate formiminotransferase